MDKSREAFEKSMFTESFMFSTMWDEDGCEYDCIYTQSMWLAWQEQQKRIDGLQAKVEAVKQLIGEYKDPAITSDKSFQHGLLLVVDELEQALKGGEE